mgnify:FL=1
MNPLPPAAKVYGEAITLMKWFFDSPDPINAASAHRLASVAGDMITLLQEDDQELLALACRSTREGYIYAHCANVAVLSLRLGCGLRWKRDQLLRLGIAALAHDLGMRPWLKQVSQDRKLTAKEYKEMQLHVTETARLLGRFELGEAEWRPVADIILLEQERQDIEKKSRARDLPDEIRRSSQIIGICDAYEAMCHPRSWRKTILPHDAVRAVVRLPEVSFERDLIRLFLSYVTPYPPGSYVILSNQEMARIIRVYQKHPTRPTVLPLVSAEGERKPISLVIDLEKESVMFHIERHADETAEPVLDPRLRAQLEANRWWGG